MTSYTADRLAHLNTAEHSFHCNRMNERDTPRQIHNNKKQIWIRSDDRSDAQSPPPFLLFF